MKLPKGPSYACLLCDNDDELEHHRGSFAVRAQGIDFHTARLYIYIVGRAVHVPFEDEATHYDLSEKEELETDGGS